MYNLFVNRINTAAVGEKSEIMKDDSTSVYPAPEGFLIDSVRHAVKGSFEIKIAGRTNRVHTLTHNEKFVETLLPNETSFSFESVSLKKGNNRFIIWALTSEGKSILVDSFSVKYSSPRLEYLMNPVYRVNTAEKKVALTFDGGSSNKGTQQILDILYEKKIKCTMFLTGRFIENFPDLVNQIVGAGHEIGNHTLSHPHLTNYEIDKTTNTRQNVTYDYFQSQLNKTDSIYFALRKEHLMPYWRAPFGETNSEILRWAAELGYRHIQWSYRGDSWDWAADKNSTLYRTSKEIKEHFLNLERSKGLNGKILLMHLGSERKDDYPYQNLASLIDELRNRGYKFLKISELLKSK